MGLNVALWMGDGYKALVEAAEREGDAGAITALAGQAQRVQAMQIGDLSAALSRRLGIARAWQLFLEQHPVVLLPVSAELPFENDLDLQGPQAYERVWRAQTTSPRRAAGARRSASGYFTSSTGVSHCAITRWATLPMTKRPTRP
ncbi:MAG: amidase [Ramlibacter sp.]|nr:amidase [Ramlibacter sp.]